MKRECGRWGYRLRGFGYKCTPGRELILEILESTDEHLSPEEIYSKVSIDHPEIGLTTVYRTLDMLVNLGVVSKLDFGEGKSRYELSEHHSHKKHHHHLVCNKCGKIIDYSDFINEEIEFLNKIESKLGKKYNFKISSHFIKFDGMCNDCI